MADGGMWYRVERPVAGLPVGAVVTMCPDQPGALVATVRLPGAAGQLVRAVGDGDVVPVAGPPHRGRRGRRARPTGR